MMSLSPSIFTRVKKSFHNLQTASSRYRWPAPSILFNLTPLLRLSKEPNGQSSDLVGRTPSARRLLCPQHETGPANDSRSRLSFSISRGVRVARKGAAMPCLPPALSLVRMQPRPSPAPSLVSLRRLAPATGSVVLPISGIALVRATIMPTLRVLKPGRQDRRHHPRATWS